MKNLLQKIAVVLTYLSLGLAFLAPQAQAEEDFQGQSAKIGVVGDYDEKVWQQVAERAKEEAGIDLEIVLMTDYNTPNSSLADGSLDLNAFQHLAFLRDWNEANDADLQSIGFTSLNPLRLFSEKYESLADLLAADKVEIAIPNDPTNGGRALLALQTAGLIDLADYEAHFPSVDDVVQKDGKDVAILELDAAQLSHSLADVDGALINVAFASDAGLDFDQALFNDGEDVSKLSDDYKNVIVVRSEDVDNPLYLKLVELYQTDETEKILFEASNGGSLAAWK